MSNTCRCKQSCPKLPMGFVCFRIPTGDLVMSVLLAVVGENFKTFTYVTFRQRLSLCLPHTSTTLKLQLTTQPPPPLRHFRVPRVVNREKSLAAVVHNIAHNSNSVDPEHRYVRNFPLTPRCLVTLERPSTIGISVCSFWRAWCWVIRTGYRPEPNSVTRLGRRALFVRSNASRE